MLHLWLYYTSISFLANQISPKSQYGNGNLCILIINPFFITCVLYSKVILGYFISDCENGSIGSAVAQNAMNVTKYSFFCFTFKMFFCFSISLILVSFFDFFFFCCLLIPFVLSYNTFHQQFDKYSCKVNGK